MSKTEEKTEQCRLGIGFNGGSSIPDDCPAAATIPFFADPKGSMFDVSGVRDACRTITDCPHRARARIAKQFEWLIHGDITSLKMKHEDGCERDFTLDYLPAALDVQFIVPYRGRRVRVIIQTDYRGKPLEPPCDSDFEWHDHLSEEDKKAYNRSRDEKK
jgi:hypothetical protein